MAPFKLSFIKKSGYQGEYERCRLMKVSKNVAGPIISKILVGITEDKEHGMTLKGYALQHCEQGMTLKSFESIFSEEHEIKAILENPDNFHSFDQTLKFKCIRIFMNFNPKLVRNASLKGRIQTQIDALKKIRNNNLCHNREILTESRCLELAHKMKALLVDLTDVMKHTWDKSIDLSDEEKKIEISIKEIMNGPLSLDEFRYMCIQLVIRFVAEPIMHTITKLICYDKEEDNYESYILNKGISKSKCKDIFYSEEKAPLKGKSSEIKPDLTLCAKIINICKDWHKKLNQKAKNELKLIIGNTRGIRNSISHKMLSMTSEECIMEAKKLGDCLTELGMYAEKMDLYEGMDVPEIDIKQIAVDINSIMLLPYKPYP